MPSRSYFAQVTLLGPLDDDDQNALLQQRYRGGGLFFTAIIALICVRANGMNWCKQYHPPSALRALPHVCHLSLLY